MWFVFLMNIFRLLQSKFDSMEIHMANPRTNYVVVKSVEKVLPYCLIKVEYTKPEEFYMPPMAPYPRK